MVSSISGYTDYSSIGSLSKIFGQNNTQNTDTSFSETMEDSISSYTDISEKATQDTDLYEYIKDSLGTPAGLEIEGFDYTQESSQSTDTQASTGSAQGSSGESDSYDEMDLNQDGVVTAEEILQYMQMQMQDELADTLSDSLSQNSSENTTGGLNTKNALNAYQNSSMSFTGSAMSIAV